LPFTAAFIGARKHFLLNGIQFAQHQSFTWHSEVLFNRVEHKTTTMRHVDSSNIHDNSLSPAYLPLWLTRLRAINPFFDDYRWRTQSMPAQKPARCRWTNKKSRSNFRRQKRSTVNQGLLDMVVEVDWPWNLRYGKLFWIAARHECLHKWLPKEIYCFLIDCQWNLATSF
jgi:hypothetical protein